LGIPSRRQRREIEPGKSARGRDVGGRRGGVPWENSRVERSQKKERAPGGTEGEKGGYSTSTPLHLLRYMGPRLTKVKEKGGKG